MGRNHDPLDRRYRSGDHSGRHAREASQRPHGLDVECGSYERATGTVVTDRRARGLVFAPSGATFSRDGPGCSRA
jgi:hypothetical protein